MDKVHTIEREQTTEKTNDIRMEILRSDVSQLDPPKMEAFVLQLEKKLSLNCKGDKFLPLTGGFRQFFHDTELDANGIPVNPNLEHAASQKNRFVALFSELYHHAGELNIRELATKDVNGDEFQFGQRITRLIETVDDAYEMIFRYVRMYERINHPTYVPIQGDMDHSIFRCKTIGPDEKDENTPYQKLLLYLLNQCYLLKMRRYGDYCCKQIETADGHLTKAWKPVMEIKDFVYHYTQKEDKYDMWRNMTSKGSAVADVVKHLTNCKDLQFPPIKKNRNVWSFRNGIFVGKEWEPTQGKYICTFYQYGSTEIQTLDPTIVSCKYFDQDFVTYDHMDDWYSVPTPHMQSVMDYQKFSEDVCRWIYVFCGRLCYQVNDMDCWQVIPFLKGIAQSGKSTIITKVCKKFYDSQDVKTLSNNIEKKFGLESILGGFMFISPEVKGDLALEQAEFQSLVSGEDLSIARKFKTAQSLTWDVPGILAGNEVPNWRDNSGSILRRIVTWNFGKQVQQADPTLEDKLDTEIPAIMCKCIRAYLEYSQKYHDKDIWTVLPAYFKTVQTQVAMVTNTLQNYLASGKLKYGSDMMVPQQLFVAEFNKHCQENNLGRPRFNPDFYAGPFSSRELEVRQFTGTYNGTAYANKPFLFGCDLIREAAAFDDY